LAEAWGSEVHSGAYWQQAELCIEVM